MKDVVRVCKGHQLFLCSPVRAGQDVSEIPVIALLVSRVSHFKPQTKQEAGMNALLNT